MLFAIDIGNTSMVFAVIDDSGIIKHKWRLDTAVSKNLDEYSLWLDENLKKGELGVKDINGVIISSVVPNKNFEIINFCSHCLGVKPLVVGQEETVVKCLEKVGNPSEVGADLICNLTGAYAKYGGNLIVIDFGTATTFDVLDGEGNFIGSSFMAGINISLEALYERTALLPHIEVKKPKKVIGRDTVEAMTSGIFWGYLSLVEGLVAKIIKEYGHDLRVVATGGLAPIFIEETTVFDVYDADITLKGLYKIYCDSRNITKQE
ncbi:MAG: type III pantothenate kinase [Alphaproteobacteria bacterium]